MNYRRRGFQAVTRACGTSRVPGQLLAPLTWPMLPIRRERSYLQPPSKPSGCSWARPKSCRPGMLPIVRHCADSLQHWRWPPNWPRPLCRWCASANTRPWMRGSVRPVPVLSKNYVGLPWVCARNTMRCAQRSKYLKSQMYRRAKIDLLRLRVLHPT
jgi:hypothetical protein